MDKRYVDITQGQKFRLLDCQRFLAVRPLRFEGPFRADFHCSYVPTAEFVLLDSKDVETRITIAAEPSEFYVRESVMRVDNRTRFQKICATGKMTDIKSKIFLIRTLCDGDIKYVDAQDVYPPKTEYALSPEQINALFAKSIFGQRMDTLYNNIVAGIKYAHDYK